MVRVLHLMGSAMVEARSIPDAVVAWNRILQEQDHCSVALFLDGDGPLVAELRDVGIEATGIYAVRRRFAAAAAVRHLRPDIVHQHFGGRLLRLMVTALSRRP